MAICGPHPDTTVMLFVFYCGSTVVFAFYCIIVFYCGTAVLLQGNLHAMFNQTTDWFWHNVAMVMWIGSLLLLAFAVGFFVFMVGAPPKQIPSGARICTSIVCYIVSALGVPLAISFPEQSPLVFCGIVTSGIVGIGCVLSLTYDDDPPEGAVEVMVRPPCLELRQAEEGELCPICLDSFVEGKDETMSEPDTVASLKCGHGFHQHCIEVWLNAKSNAKCPVCRQSSASD